MSLIGRYNFANAFFSNYILKWQNSKIVSTSLKFLKLPKTTIFPDFLNPSLPTSHSAYAATETELYAAKIDGLLQRGLNRWSKLSEQNLRFLSKVKILKNGFNEKWWAYRVYISQKKVEVAVIIYYQFMMPQSLVLCM